MANRTPPYNHDAEVSVLGGMMLSPRAALEVIDLLAPEDFHFAFHQHVFTAIRDLVTAGKAHDYLTVTERMRASGLITGNDIAADVMELQVNCASAANILAHANVIRQKSLLRGLIQTCTEAAESAYSASGDPTLCLEMAEASLFTLRSRGGRGANQADGMDTLMDQADQQIENARQGNGHKGISSGLTELDQLTNGMHPGDLIILGARPGMGKTTLAMNIAEHVGIQCKTPVLVFSMEMQKSSLVQRMIASQARIPLDVVRSGSLSDSQANVYTHIGAQLRAASIRIDDTAALTPLELRARARRSAARFGLGLIVVDYLGLMRVPGIENRTNEIAEISRSLKALAKDLSVPVLALSQLNRGVEGRHDNKRPRMSDLRDSGGIEQDADLIAFIYRDEVYNPEGPHKGIAELIVAKHRNGPTGTIELAYSAPVCRFENYSGPSKAQRLPATPERQSRAFVPPSAKPTQSLRMYAD